MAFAKSNRPPAAWGGKGGVEKQATLIGANFCKFVLHFASAEESPMETPSPLVGSGPEGRASSAETLPTLSILRFALALRASVFRQSSRAKSEIDCARRGLNCFAVSTMHIVPRPLMGSNKKRF